MKTLKRKKDIFLMLLRYERLGWQQHIFNYIYNNDNTELNILASNYTIEDHG